MRSIPASWWNSKTSTTMLEITGTERDALILEILNRIDTDPQRIASPERVAAWEKGWQEALDKFRADPKEENIIPAFIRPGKPLRVQQKFVQPEDPDAELNYCRWLQRGVLAPLFSDCASITEFGCGTGFNLVALGRVYPQKPLYGFDFSEFAVEMTAEAGKALGVNILTAYFDMKTLEPFPYTLGKDAGVFTFGAIEQLGSGFEKFIEYLIDQKPKLVVHIEPIVELMDPKNLVDALGIRFHRKRGYTEGLLPYLQWHPKVEVLDVQRSYFGSLMFESYGRIVWRVR